MKKLLRQITLTQQFLFFSVFLFNGDYNSDREDEDGKDGEQQERHIGICAAAAHIGRSAAGRGEGYALRGCVFAFTRTARETAFIRRTAWRSETAAHTAGRVKVDASYFVCPVY